ncbi:conserved domain protein [Streptococcus constellatus subsp. pharyngis SK1060 = CCUG 46377]|uniref:Conserved domain protein n=1 Tax=Streptococcus constellatus subsp. pharyngis SK1060 = CCUG 46377 TaxID=1035184 RepID=F9P7E9_STRCV|nr:conserved domain protein [Streptococcus constellatus subsp. pharyngis SK1060 = CCUG 46377]
MELRLVSTLFKKMIKGHGIDIEEISSIQKVYEKMLALLGKF